MTATSLQIAQVAAAAADSKKAEDIVLIDLSGKTDEARDLFLEYNPSSALAGTTARWTPSSTRSAPR